MIISICEGLRDPFPPSLLVAFDWPSSLTFRLSPSSLPSLLVTSWLTPLDPLWHFLRTIKKTYLLIFGKFFQKMARFCRKRVRKFLVATKNLLNHNWHQPMVEPPPFTVDHFVTHFVWPPSIYHFLADPPPPSLLVTFWLTPLPLGVRPLRNICVPDLSLLPGYWWIFAFPFAGKLGYLESHAFRARFKHFGGDFTPIFAYFSSYSLGQVNFFRSSC